MKKFSLLIFTVLISSFLAFTYAQVDVTFQVDMSQQAVSGDGVSVAGNFQVAAGYPSDWTPGGTMLTEETPGIYSVTVQLPAGTYAFKYINGISWGQDESVPVCCVVDNNRQLVVGSDPVVLDAVYFGTCHTATAVNYDVTFQVNMADQSVTDGVFVAGNFQGWSASASEMTVAYDDVYEFTASLPLGMCVEYKFILGPGNWETVPGGCNSGGNRVVSVPDGGIVLDPVCWGECVDCAAPSVDVTFQVDMSNETVAGDVNIVGSFQGWNLGASTMTDAGSGIYTLTVNINVGEHVTYKYINGNDWGLSEIVPSECGEDDGYGGFNRSLDVLDVNTILDPVCFGSCEACEGGTTDLFFSEYAEGDGGNNKYVEIYNGTGGTVDLSNYRTHRISNGGNWDEYIYDFAPGAVIEDGAVYVISNSQSITEITEKADEFTALCYFNGDDAVGLSKLVGGDWQIIDVIGAEGPDPGSGWEVAGVSSGTANHTLVRKPDVCGPNADWTSSAGTDPNDSEWIVYDANTWDYLGFHNAVCGGSALVATPSFSVSGGNYLVAFDLEISCDTPDATIYFTTNGSDPDQSSTLYSGAINISTSTEVKAKAFAIGYGSSFTASASYVFPVDVANLAELRTAFVTDPDGLYKVTGEVVITYQQSYRGQKWLQDTTAGVMIDDPNGVITTGYAVYDGITDMIGNLTEYGGMIEFLPDTDPGAATSTENVIVPKIITINDLVGNFEDYESELVQILGVSFDAAGATFDDGTPYAISDVSKADGFFRTTFYGEDYIGTVIPPVEIGVTGICNSRYNGDYITARNLADLDIPDYIIVTSPNGGEQIEQGADFDITWSSNVEGVFLTVALVLPDKAFETLAENVAIEDGAFTWSVTQEYGDNYKVAVYAEPIKILGDESDAFFSIVPPIDVKITEIMYNPPEAGTDILEFVEFYNNGEGTINLLDWEMTEGADFVFPEHILNPGEYVVVCENAAAFMSTFGVVAYEWSGSLKNSGEDIDLIDNAGFLRAYVNYDDYWYPETRGNGPSLTFCDPSLDNEDQTNWGASTTLAAINTDGNGIYCTPMAGCGETPVLPVFYTDGWTSMSSNLEPAKISMEELFAPVDAKMIILLNDMGIYWPVQSINTIGEWDSYKGYKVKFNYDAYFVFNGTEMTNKVFEYGVEMTLVPVLSKEPISLLSLIPQFEGNVEFMFDLETGNVYWPEGGIVPGVVGALETLMPGHAYFTKFTAPGSIDFDLVPPKAGVTATTVFENYTAWSDVNKTGVQHIISITETALDGLEANDMIGAFNAQGNCVGMASYSGEETVLPLVVYGDDMTTEAIDGMIEGENLNFRVYRFGQEIEAAAIYNMQIQNHDGLFAENGLSMINGFKLGATGIGEQNNAYSIYPNPGNGQLNIDVVGSFDVTVSNAQGQLVYKGQINGNSVINLSDQPEGIYFIKLTGETSTMIEKVIIK